jgi:hypothetical protein
MVKTLSACIPLTIVLLASPAGAHAADVLRPSSVAVESVASGRGASTVSVSCPAPAVALNAAVTRKPAGVTVRRSTPGTGPGDWRFRLFGATPAGAQGTRVVLRCIRLAVPPGLSGARLVVRTRRSPGIAVPAGGSSTVQLRCGPAWLATGYGLDVGRSRDVRLASAVPVAHGWDFVLENTGSGPVTAGVSARCLKQIVTADRDGGSAQLRFRVTRPAFSNTLGSGATTFSHTCGRSRFSLATGSIVDALDRIELAASGPLGSSAGRWTFRRASEGDAVRTFLVCLSRRSGFR